MIHLFEEFRNGGVLKSNPTQAGLSDRVSDTGRQPESRSAKRANRHVSALLRNEPIAPYRPAVDILQAFGARGYAKITPLHRAHQSG